MRIGKNPNIHKEVYEGGSSHRVIIPIYVPNAEGYFEGAFEVLKASIQSLLQTINNDTRISLISNACSHEVNHFLMSLYAEGKVDRVIYNTENVGKMNAIISETRASYEEFITYADADVFFDKGWLSQTFTMFSSVPKAGFVSMNPTPLHLSFASSTLLDNLGKYLFNKTKKINEVCAYEDLKHFHESIGRKKEATDRMFNDSSVAIVKDTYIIGAGHFCCTIRKTPTMRYVPKYKSTMGVSGGSENKYLDIPFDKTGLWRLSSPKAYVWHMGNSLDHKWAQQKLSELQDFKEDNFSFDSIALKNRTWQSLLLPYIVKVKLVNGIKKLYRIK